jgi:hypothetical protein
LLWFFVRERLVVLLRDGRCLDFLLTPFDAARIGVTVSFSLVETLPIPARVARRPLPSNASIPAVGRRLPYREYLRHPPFEPERRIFGEV